MVEYFDDIHEYLVDGVLVPSVSTLVAYATGDIYKDVPRHILEASAEYGTKVHEAIETFETGGIVDSEFYPLIAEWTEIVEKNNINVFSMEEIVYTKDYAGRYDMLATVDNEESLIDIKTTTKLHERNLSIQMGLYTHAMGRTIPCYCLWIPKNGDMRFVPVTPISPEECEELVNAYKMHLEPPRETKALEGINIYTPEETAKLRRFYALKNEIESIEKEAKKRAISFMEEKGIKSFDNEDFKITYIPETTKKVVDTDRMKLDGIYDDYTKETKVKATVRITWRNQNEA